MNFRSTSGRGRLSLLRLSGVVLLSTLLSTSACAASTQQPDSFTHADTLRGTNGPARSWWDVTFYDLHVAVSPETESIRGWNAITYRVIEPGQEMQIDLQLPLEVDSIVQGGRRLTHRRDGNAFFVELAKTQATGDLNTVSVYYHGAPRVAVNPPWDGGFIWQRDGAGDRWAATANQGLGASVWWPTKDLQSEEPDSQRIAITVPDPMVNVSNGRLRSTTPNGDGTTTYEWFVSEPINNYSITVSAGSYAHWSEEFAGESGPLTLDFWPLAENEAAARRQWTQVRTTMQCFEHWFGPFPWYDDGYKMIETPHLGMEHQSAIAYGNGYQNGYLGRDLSGTGHGLTWDFIVVHESAHEWWGNNITSADIAENWIHEGFANYAENLYIECTTGDKTAGSEYVIGTRAGITNNSPIVGSFGVNNSGPGDMYAKGGNLLHMIRQLVDDDDRWRAILRGLNETFWHQTVTGSQVEGYMSEMSGIDLSPVFDQYLRTTQIPVLEYRAADGGVEVRWSNVVTDFVMPVRVHLVDGTWGWVRPTTEWSRVTAPLASDFEVDARFYVEAQPGG